MILNRSCNVFVSSVTFYLLCFSIAKAEFDTQSNKTLEKRLHSIYVQHYQRPIIDSDWFKVIEGIDLQTHKVQSGDTLWLISKVYFGDGHYWSKLWSVNKNITNPHLIFAGDTIHFTSGSFSQAPSIRVEKKITTNTISSTDSDELSQESYLDDGVGYGYLQKPLVPLPDIFNETYVPVKSEDSPITFVPRPKIQFRSDFHLTKEILVKPLNLVGRIRSLGSGRVITAEGSILLVQSKHEMTLGDVLSVVQTSEDSINEGYPIDIRASIQITKKISEQLYEARVLQQYDPINVGDRISDYRVKVVNADIPSQEPKEVPLHILRGTKSIWAAGDVLFFKAVAGSAIELGDILKISNKHTDDINFYISNGFVKVVSVSPPFATGVVISSREDIRTSSVSSPTPSQ